MSEATPTPPVQTQKGALDPDGQEAATRAELMTRPITSSTFLAKNDRDDDAWVTSAGLTTHSVTVTDGKLLDTSGLATTESNGQLVFRLKDQIGQRPDDIDQFFEPVNLLATPRGKSPVFMTVSHRLIKGLSPWYTDVEITVSAWKPDGKAAADVHFYWRCRVPADAIIFLGHRFGPAPPTRRR